MRKSVIKRILRYYSLYAALNNFIAHFILLFTRIWIGNIYLKSGLTKISVWDQTLILFEYEYEVPFLPVELAAIMSTAAELICPILLFVGIFSRLSILPLFIMTIIIELFIIQNVHHLYWLFMMAVIMGFGSGRISIDGFLAQRFRVKI